MMCDLLSLSSEKFRETIDRFKQEVLHDQMHAKKETFSVCEMVWMNSVQMDAMAI